MRPPRPPGTHVAPAPPGTAQLCVHFFFCTPGSYALVWPPVLPGWAQALPVTLQSSCGRIRWLPSACFGIFGKCVGWCMGGTRVPKWARPPGHSSANQCHRLWPRVVVSQRPGRQPLEPSTLSSVRPVMSDRSACLEARSHSSARPRTWGVRGAGAGQARTMIPTPPKLEEGLVWVGGADL